MDNKINGRTPEEIKKGLEYYAETDFAKKLNTCKQDLKYWYAEDVAVDALAYIQQLERERDEARNDLDTINYANTELYSAYEAMKRERDAAVTDMTELMQLAQFCRHCKHITEDGECTFDFAANKGDQWCWQWRGVQEVDDENT